MPTPSLLPLPPLADAPIELSSDRFVVRDPRDPATGGAVLEVRDGRWVLLPGDRALRRNGTSVDAAAVLRDRDQITLPSGATYEFASGEMRTRRMESLAPRRTRRPRIRLPHAPRRLSLAAVGTVFVAMLLVAAAAAIFWYGARKTGVIPGILSDRQATELDSLLVTAYDHVERGSTLLELGLGEGAGQEFARAVNTLALSDLRNEPQVKRRITALQASVGAIYREASLAVPENYAGATSPLTPDQLKTASLTVDQFAAQFALMAAAFHDRWGHDIVVTGRDHAEHVALYGKGGAIDLSARAMNPAEIAFVIDQCHARHIRIKDFSQDSVLWREVQAAVHAGLLFEAGTGLHLHIDRFANRRDRWTTTRSIERRGGEGGDRWALPGVAVDGPPERGRQLALQ